MSWNEETIRDHFHWSVYFLGGGIIHEEKTIEPKGVSPVQVDGFQSILKQMLELPALIIISLWFSNPSD